VSALFNREHPPRRHPHDGDDTTAEIPVPTIHLDQPDDAPSSADGDEQGRLRPTARTRLKAGLLLGVYACATLGSVWLMVLAFVRLNSVVMVLMIGAAMWLGRDAIRLGRWLFDGCAQAMRLSRLQRVVACVLAATYAWLFVDWLLHQ
jgi:hypothetical protein